MGVQVGKTYRITNPKDSLEYLQFTILEITGDDALVSIKEMRKDGHSIYPFVPTTKKNLNALLAEEEPLVEEVTE